MYVISVGMIKSCIYLLILAAVGACVMFNGLYTPHIIMRPVKQHTHIVHSYSKADTLLDFPRINDGRGSYNKNTEVVSPPPTPPVKVRGAHTPFSCNSVGWDYELSVPTFDKRFETWKHASAATIRELCGYGAPAVLEKSNDAVYVDVGANFGLATLPYASKGWTVFAFEPVRLNMEVLKVNTRKYPHVYTFLAAVSNKSGAADIFVPKGQEDNSAVGGAAVADLNVHTGKVTHEKVEFVTLDDILLKRHDFEPHNVRVIKIDTQGHEINVLKGMRRLSKMLSMNAKIMVENDDKLQRATGRSSVELVAVIRDLGFECWCGDVLVPPPQHPTCIDIEGRRRVFPAFTLAPASTCPFTPPSSGDGAAGGGWAYTDDVIAKQHVVFDAGVVSVLSRVLKGQSVTDVGAGVGQLGVALKQTNADVDWRGFDGGHNIQEYEGKTVNPRGSQRGQYVVPRVCWIDATSRSQMRKIGQTDWVVSIEVGEHIEKAKEHAFLDNLATVARRGIILSWAVPRQGGFGHVNEQSNEYVVEQMHARGFAHKSALSLELRQAVQQHSWLRNTLAAFMRRGGINRTMLHTPALAPSWSKCEETTAFEWSTNNLGNMLETYFELVAIRLFKNCTVYFLPMTVIGPIQLPSKIVPYKTNFLWIDESEPTTPVSSGGLWVTAGARILHAITPVIHRVIAPLLSTKTFADTRHNSLQMQRRTVQSALGV